MGKDSEMKKYGKDKFYLVNLLNINYGSIDSYIFMPNGRYTLKIGDNQTVTLRMEIPQNHDILICLQMKKDLQVVFDEYNLIITKWEKKKAELKEIHQNCLFLLFLVTQSTRKEDGRKRESFKKEDKDVYIVFADEANYSYFFK